MLTVEDLIKLYAEAAVRDMTETSDETFQRRVDFHAKLCAALGIDNHKFAPFEFGESIAWTVAMAERMIRMELRRLKK